MLPSQVGALTPFQVSAIYFADRDTKTGAPVLDGPLGDADPVGLTLAGEFRAEFLRRGVTDPDALDALVREAVAADAAAWAGGGE